MAKPKAPTSAARLRPAPARPAASASAVATRAEQHAPKKRRSFGEVLAGIPIFFREVRVEARRITWPSRRETWITAVMVMIMVVVMSLFFLVVDEALSQAIQFILKIPAMVSK